MNTRDVALQGLGANIHALVFGGLPRMSEVAIIVKKTNIGAKLPQYLLPQSGTYFKRKTNGN